MIRIDFYMLFEIQTWKRFSKCSPQRKDAMLICNLKNRLVWVDDGVGKKVCWASCTSLHKDIYRQFTVKVYVFTGLVLCRGGKIRDYLESTRILEQERISTFTARCSKRSRRWTRSSGHRNRIPKDDLNVCQCTTTLTTKTDNVTICVKIQQMCVSMSRSFPWVMKHSLVQGMQKWYGTLTYKPEGTWNRTAKETILNFAGSGHPVFRETSLLYTSTWNPKLQSSFFAQYIPPISSVFTKQSRTGVITSKCKRQIQVLNLSLR